MRRWKGGRGGNIKPHKIGTLSLKRSHNMGLPCWILIADNLGEGLCQNCFFSGPADGQTSNLDIFSLVLLFVNELKMQWTLVRHTMIQSNHNVTSDHLTSERDGKKLRYNIFNFYKNCLKQVVYNHSYANSKLQIRQICWCMIFTCAIANVFIYNC